MTRIGIAIILLLTALIGWAFCVPGDKDSVPAPLIGQQTKKWCWAASGQMTMNAVYREYQNEHPDTPTLDIQQCDEANKRLGHTDCCNSPVPATCIRSGWPEFENYNFSGTRKPGPLSWEEIKLQIACARKPFAFAWHWFGGGAHMMVSTGYDTIDGRHLVAFNDPLPVAPPNANSAANVGGGTLEVVTYETFVGGVAYDHTFWDTVFDIEYLGSP